MDSTDVASSMSHTSENEVHMQWMRLAMEMVRSSIFYRPLRLDCFHIDDEITRISY